MARSPMPRPATLRLRVNHRPPPVQRPVPCVCIGLEVSDSVGPSLESRSWKCPLRVTLKVDLFVQRSANLKDLDKSDRDVARISSLVLPFKDCPWQPGHLVGFGVGSPVGCVVRNEVFFSGLVFFQCKNGVLDLCDLQLPLEALPT